MSLSTEWSEKLCSWWEMQPWCKAGWAWLQRPSFFIMPHRVQLQNRCTLIFLVSVNKQSSWFINQCLMNLVAPVPRPTPAPWSNIFWCAGKREYLIFQLRTRLQARNDPYKASVLTPFSFNSDRHCQSISVLFFVEPRHSLKVLFNTVLQEATATCPVRLYWFAGLDDSDLTKLFHVQLAFPETLTLCPSFLFPRRVDRF